MSETGKCPVMHGGGKPAGRANRDWWPDQLDLSVLHRHSPRANPLDDGFEYADAFASLDVNALKQDVMRVMTTSQAWWPADYGHYGPTGLRSCT